MFHVVLAMRLFKLLVLFNLPVLLSSTFHGMFWAESEDSPPFIVWNEENESNKSLITLTCRRPADGFKDNVKTAFFYRNGVVENTADPCLQGTSRPYGYHDVYITPECEGHFMCAVLKQVDRDGWQYDYHILSASEALYGTLVD